MDTHMEQDEQASIVGESGYSLSKIWMRSFLDPLEGSPESRYNNAHLRASSVVEQTIVLWKMRFRKILKERTARYKPNFVSSIIKTKAVLHDMCIENNVPIPQDEDFNDEQHPNEVQNNDMKAYLATQKIVK